MLSIFVQDKVGILSGIKFSFQRLKRTLLIKIIIIYYNERFLIYSDRDVSSR